METLKRLSLNLKSCFYRDRFIFIMREAQVQQAVV